MIDKIIEATESLNINDSVIDINDSELKNIISRHSSIFKFGLNKSINKQDKSPSLNSSILKIVKGFGDTTAKKSKV